MTGMSRVFDYDPSHRAIDCCPMVIASHSLFDVTWPESPERLKHATAQ